MRHHRKSTVPCAAVALAACLGLPACDRSDPAPARADADCLPGAAPLELTGTVAQDEARTYRVFPFAVGPGTGRVELSYQWTDRPGPPGTPLTATTLDLGLWDEKGYRTQEGFRGWGGSRQGRIDRDQPPVFVEAGAADRGFRPGRVNPGTWHAELGIAAVSPQGADWLLRIECKPAGGAAPSPDRVDPQHVAKNQPGWYHGDFHMHAFHSNPGAPGWDEFVALAQAAKLDFLMVTEYVTPRHWDTLGAVQRAYPGIVIWPGREIITYFGHVNTHGETPGLYEYRHGFEDVDLGEIQQEAARLGALFQVNHPTFFPGPVFENFCRGCEFRLGDRIDWNRVDTIEILTGPVLATCADVDGSCPLPGAIENPFLQTAIDLWEDLLLQGYRITAVSGSDSKGVEPDDVERQRRGYGSSATAVYAEALSRPALKAAIRAGRAYVRTRGVERSPSLDFRAVGADGTDVMFGGTLTVGQDEAVTLRTTVAGGSGQLLRYIVNGNVLLQVPIVTDPFEHETPAFRLPDEGPLGTFWRIETLDAQTRTAIGNPVFLKGPP